MAETLNPQLPPDHLEEKPNGTFSGSGYIYQEASGVTKVVEVPFDRIFPLELPPFYYQKPVIKDSSLDPKNRDSFDIIEDENPREGYYLLAYAPPGKRPPNHLFAADEGIFAAANFGTEDNPKWQPRYFPRKNLGEAFWEEAMRNYFRARLEQVTLNAEKLLLAKGIGDMDVSDIDYVAIYPDSQEEHEVLMEQMEKEGQVIESTQADTGAVFKLRRPYKIQNRIVDKVRIRVFDEKISQLGYVDYEASDYEGFKNRYANQLSLKVEKSRDGIEVLKLEDENIAIYIPELTLGAELINLERDKNTVVNPTEEQKRFFAEHADPVSWDRKHRELNPRIERAVKDEDNEEISRILSELKSTQEPDQS